MFVMAGRERISEADDSRRNHLKTLQRRTRFRAKLIADENEPQVNQERGSTSQPVHHGIIPTIPHPSFPCSHLPNSHVMMNNIYHQGAHPYSRRYSLASYPIYIPNVPVVPPIAYYYPPTPQYYPNPVTSENVANPPQQDDFDDDDVFSVPPVHHYIPPESPSSLRQQERRKRARSAGDVIMQRDYFQPFSGKPFIFGQSGNNPGTMGSGSHRVSSQSNIIVETPAKKMRRSPVQDNQTSSTTGFQGHINRAQGQKSNFKIGESRGHKKSFQGESSDLEDRIRQGQTDYIQGQNSHYNGNSHQGQVHTFQGQASDFKSRGHNKEKSVDCFQDSSSSKDSIEANARKKKRVDMSDNEPSSSTNAVKTLSLKSSLASNRPSSSKKKVIWEDLPQENLLVSTQTPKVEDLVDIKEIKKDPSKFLVKNKIGPYLIGQKLGACPVKCVSQYIVRKENTNKHYMAKILSMGGSTSEVRSGKMLLHTEHSLLSMLDNHPGVVRHHGLFKDHCYDEKSGSLVPRVGLILDCLTKHDQDPKTKHYLNLQQYVIQAKHLSERETIRIFYLIVSVIHSLHKINVVHRDLKLGNMVLDKRSRRVTLTNFCLGCHLGSEEDTLTDQRGSPAYISPDVLSGKPYAGKPSDMWSLGVILFTMLYGQFPFYDLEPKKLFSKIKKADYSIPKSGQVSLNTNEIIRGLLTLNPAQRLTAHDTLGALESCAAMWNTLRTPLNPAQVVPDIDDKEHQEPEVYETEEESLSHENQLSLAFERKLLSDDDCDDSAICNPHSFRGGVLLNQLPTARHVNHDALPLSQDEMTLHHRLLTNARAPCVT